MYPRFDRRPKSHRRPQRFLAGKKGEKVPGEKGEKVPATKNGQKKQPDVVAGTCSDGDGRAAAVERVEERLQPGLLGTIALVARVERPRRTHGRHPPLPGGADGSDAGDHSPTVADDADVERFMVFLILDRARSPRSPRTRADRADRRASPCRGCGPRPAAKTRGNRSARERAPGPSGFRA